MIRCFRRLWLVLVSATLAAPLILGHLTPGRITSQEELRSLAPLPALPTRTADWRALPARADDYLRDHFGLRRAMIYAQSVITHLWLRTGSTSVLVGRDNSLFFLGDDLIEQSTGRLLREQRVIETADTVARAHAILASHGVKLIFASPPNSASIYSDRLPAWAQGAGNPTEYDLMLEALAERGVMAVDLRPVLQEARARGAVYFAHDTHWTARGALAAFNAIAAIAGHASWQLHTDTTLAAPTLRTGGDLAQMLGLSDDLQEPTQYMMLPDVRRQEIEPPPFYTFEASSGRANATTVLIIGDSFTERWFPPMLADQAGRVALTHIQNCGFDWSWIDRFKPNEVWWMPTERAFLCAPTVRPKGLP